MDSRRLVSSLLFLYCFDGLIRLHGGYICIYTAKLCLTQTDSVQVSYMDTHTRTDTGLTNTPNMKDGSVFGLSVENNYLWMKMLYRLHAQLDSP
jgi:hypothetical protein